jgi:hypothetical protein
MYKLFFAALLVVSAPSFALAGGGGGHSKSTGSVEFRNESSQTIGVAVNPSSALLNSQSTDEFLRRGGRFVNPNSSITIGNVRTGNVRVVYSYEESAGQFTSRNVDVRRGETAVVTIPEFGQSF